MNEACVVLAVDQSTASSGWALLVPGSPAALGVARTAAERRAVVDAACLAADSFGLLELPIVAVLEDHGAFSFSRGNMSVRSLLGMGAARGRWQQLLEECVPARYVHMVEPRVWRRAVLGLGNVTAAQAKAAAVLHARAVTGSVVGDDAAEALCIALWAQRNVRPAAKRKPRKAVQS